MYSDLRQYGSAGDRPCIYIDLHWGANHHEGYRRYFINGSQ